MKHKRIAELLFSVCFLLFLLAAAAVTALKSWQTYSFFENRDLASWPTFTWASFWDGSYFSGMETALQDHAAGRGTLLKAKTLADLYLIRRPVVNRVIPANGKLLYFLNYEIVYPDIIAQQSQAVAENQARLQELVERYGGQVLYVSCPGQYAYFQDLHPSFLNSRSTFTQVEREIFSQAMEERGVNHLDLGDVFDALGHPDHFYSSTDHHYTYAGAYQAYLAIMDLLADDFGLELTVLTDELISFQSLPNPYIGSRLRPIFNLWPSDEHIQIGCFTDPVPFTRTNNGVPVDATIYCLPATEEEPALYDVYMGGDIAETVIDTGRPELPSLLIYGDSYTNALETLLWYSFDQTRSIDLRHYRTRSLADYIQEYQPEVVICVRDYGSMLGVDYNGNPF